MIRCSTCPRLPEACSGALSAAVIVAATTAIFVSVTLAAFLLVLTSLFGYFRT